MLLYNINIYTTTHWNTTVRDTCICKNKTESVLINDECCADDDDDDDDGMVVEFLIGYLLSNWSMNESMFYVSPLNRK